MAKRKAGLYWLPEDFRVYLMEGGGVINWAAPGTKELILPTVNRYEGTDGGYVAFYTRDKAKAVYLCMKDIYVVGQVRLKGRYNGGIFHPAGFEGKDISAEQHFKDLCRELFDVQGWAGGDTGGWLGM